MELHRKGYMAQIIAYIGVRDYPNAYSLAKEFVAQFSDDIAAHFLLSQAAFWLGKYDEAEQEGRRAFNQALDQEEMLECAIITGGSYFEAKRYAEGLEFLRYMEHRKTSEGLETLMFLFAMALNDWKEAVEHLNELYRLNPAAAEALAVDSMM